MTEFGLEFSKARARRSNPDTSHDAADRTTPKVALLERRVVGALEAFPAGLTAPEIACRLGERDGSISPRIKPLWKKGLLKATGEHRNGAMVWIAVE